MTISRSDRDIVGEFDVKLYCTPTSHIGYARVQVAKNNKINNKSPCQATNAAFGVQYYRKKKYRHSSCPGNTLQGCTLPGECRVLYRTYSCS